MLHRGLQAQSRRGDNCLTDLRSKPIARLWSPIPPMETGTATYFGMVLERMLDAGLDPASIDIVTDTAWLAAPVDDMLGCRVVDFRTIDVEQADVTDVCFTANNEFHGFVAEALARFRPHPRRHVVGVIHEPSTFMLANVLCAAGRHGFDAGTLRRGLWRQYGDSGDVHLEAFRAGRIGREFDYVTIGFNDVLLAADRLVVHSLHAFAKLYLETDIDAIRFPPTTVARHPDPPTARHVQRARWTGPGLTVGVFGRITPAKRVAEAMRGFAWFLDRVGHEAAEASRLLVVGPPDPVQEVEIERVAALLGVTRHIVRIDDADDDRFSELAGTCDVVLGLRYPSCGETSGALAHARAAGARIVATRYQAFADEHIDLSVPAPDTATALGVARALAVIHHDLAAGLAQDPSASDDEAAAVDKVLMMEILTHARRTGAWEGWFG